MSEKRYECVSCEKKFPLDEMIMKIQGGYICQECIFLGLELFIEKVVGETDEYKELENLASKLLDKGKENNPLNLLQTYEKILAYIKIFTARKIILDNIGKAALYNKISPLTSKIIAEFIEKAKKDHEAKKIRLLLLADEINDLIKTLQKS